MYFLLLDILGTCGRAIRTEDIMPPCPKCKENTHVEPAGGTYGHEQFHCNACGIPFRLGKVLKRFPRPSQKKVKIPLDILNLREEDIPYIA